MNTWGERIRLSIFGESHGEAVGCVIDGMPAGIELNYDAINTDLLRRKPNSGEYTTKRAETDDFKIVSGVNNNITCGSPICVMFKNENAHSDDYNPNVLRPSHADFPAHVKYNGYSDLRGGGHFSARLTAPLVFAGALCRQELKKRGIFVGAHLLNIGGVCDKNFDAVNACEKDLSVLDKMFPLIDTSKRVPMEMVLKEVKDAGDSVGGSVECAVVNLPVGLGEPFFDSVESVLSHLLFSVPAIKGVEFGAGFELSNMRGSRSNDQYRSVKSINGKNCMYAGEKIAHTNNAGGIIGGMTSAMPLIFRTVFKPIASIKIGQYGLDLQSMKAVNVKTEGRHDVCAALRGTVIVESIACICFWDLLLR